MARPFYRNVFVAAVLALLPWTCAAAAESDGSLFAGAAALLEQGKGNEAYSAALTALEYRPDDPAHLDLASRAAQAAGQTDESLWYAQLALDAFGHDEETEEARAAIVERMSELDPLFEEARTLHEEYAESLLDVCESIRRKRLYANVVDLLRHLDGTPFEQRAREKLEELIEEKRSAQALLESGIDVPLPSPADEGEGESYRDRKHSTWENRYTDIKGPNYTVETNAPRRFGISVLEALEQMNRFYRKVFDHKTRGGGTARSVIRVHRTKHEFMQMHGVSPSVRGFFDPNDKSVTTYDPRSAGEPFSNLWSTLFHEASHQFADMIAAGEMPGWLNEGTASYFEGARILPSGLVQTNLVPETRLRYLPRTLGRGDPALRDVVSFYEDGSYPGSYYPVGWGLVYFFRNYESEESERIYEPLFERYLATYRTGGKHDVVGRFEEYFIQKAKVPGVTSFEEFEAHFKAWIEELHSLYYGGPEAADRLLARARRQRENGKLEAAIESYQGATRKRPDDARAYFELAEVYEDLRREKWAKDAAIFSYRRALEIARSQPDPKAKLAGFANLDATGVVAECLKRIQKLDRTLQKTLGPVDDALAQGALRIAQQYLERDRPRRALDFLADSSGLIGGFGELERLAREIRDRRGIDVRRWRRLHVDADAEGWYADLATWEPADGGFAVRDRDGVALCTYGDEPPDAYRIEATIETAADRGLVGLQYGMHSNVAKMAYADVERGFFFLSEREEGAEIRDKKKPLAKIAKKDLEQFVLALEIGEDGTVEVFVNGKSIGRHTYPPGEVRGSVGLVAGGSKELRFRDIRWLY